MNRREHNTLAAFERALSLGAGGLESDVLLTADGVPVLAHAGLALRGPRISQLRREELPADVPSLADLYERCGSAFELALDMAAPQAASEIVRIAGEYGAAHRLWLTYWRLPELAEWRERWPQIHLVHAAMPLGRRRAHGLIDRLTALGVDALNVHHRFCSRRLVERSHEAGLMIFAWGVKRRARLERVAARGIDGVFCDDVPAVAALTSHGHTAM